MHLIPIMNLTMLVLENEYVFKYLSLKSEAYYVSVNSVVNHTLRPHGRSS